MNDFVREYGFVGGRGAERGASRKEGEGKGKGRTQSSGSMIGLSVKRLKSKLSRSLGSS